MVVRRHRIFAVRLHRAHLPDLQQVGRVARDSELCPEPHENLGNSVSRHHRVPRDQSEADRVQLHHALHQVPEVQKLDRGGVRCEIVAARTSFSSLCF